MFRPATRLAAGTLILALPLAAAAGCGVQKKLTIKAEFASAGSNLSSSKAVSFTLSLEDRRGKLAALAKTDHAGVVADTALASSITLTIDPAGARTLADLSGKGSCDATKKATPSDVSAALKKVNVGIVVKDATSALGELRLVDGALYAHVDLKQIGVLAKKGGVEDFDTSVDHAITSAGPKFSQALTDARDGKWLTLDLARYAGKFSDLAKNFTSQFQTQTGTSTTAMCAGAKDLSKNLVTALKPYVKVTDANDSSSDRVLDVDVKVRPALKAALNVVKAAKGLPFGKLLSGLQPADVDSSVADGSARGTITLKDGHLTQFAVDIESIRRLDPHAGKNDLTGSFVVLDVNDHADALTAPSDVSTFDVGALLDDLLNSFTRGFSSSASSGTGVAIQNG